MICVFPVNIFSVVNSPNSKGLYLSEKMNQEKNPTDSTGKLVCLCQTLCKVSLIICTHKPLFNEFEVDRFYIYIVLEMLDEGL